nr:coagulation factor X-like [Cherax quadricarinatus]
MLRPQLEAFGLEFQMSRTGYSSMLQPGAENKPDPYFEDLDGTSGVVFITLNFFYLLALATAPHTHTHTHTHTNLLILFSGDRSQASSQAVNAEDIRVQHIQTNGQLITSYIRSVHLFPGYKPGRRPSNDVSLLRLKKAITFSYHIQPACVLTQDFPGEKTAVTFKHQSGDYNWDVILQQHDSRCDSPHSACSRATNIDSNQFCANDIVSERFLEEGSSGGPYLVNAGTRAQDQWLVAGLVTFHTQDTCGKPLTIFTSLVNFWPWISQCVHEGKCTA